MREPTPAAWLAHLAERAPFFADYDPATRERFLRYLNVFLSEITFIGAGGLEITEEMRVVIGAAAVRIIVHLDPSYYDRLTEIVVYPHDYKHPDKDGVIYGEAHTWGTVVLSWPAVLRGMANPHDRHDTAVHEFAHVLDIADGAFDGTPELHASGHYSPWGDVMSRHFFQLKRTRRRRHDVLRQYGATNEAEFFAVATEAFFEDPERLRDKAPDLYDELARFYRVPEST